MATYDREKWKMDRSSALVKVCTKCNKNLPLDAFHTDKQKIDGLYSSCIACNSHKRNDPVKKAVWDKQYRARDNHYINKKAKEFNVSVEYLEKLYKDSKGVCAICNKPETAISSHKHRRIRMLCIDHDHKTDKIRGVLCGRCNAAIGHFKDDVNSMHAAIRYLNNFNNLQNNKK